MYHKWNKKNKKKTKKEMSFVKQKQFKMNSSTWEK